MIGNPWQNEVAPVWLATIFLAIPGVLFARLTRPSPLATTQSTLQEAIDEDYRKAADQARSPNSNFVDDHLERFTFDHPVTVVTWKNGGRWKSTYPGAVPGKTFPTTDDIWVVVGDSLRNFCRSYRQSHNPDTKELTLRLNQHMGLPPTNDADTFIELTVDPSNKPGAKVTLFRPCVASSTESPSCGLPDLPKASEVWDNNSQSTPTQEWLLRNYYATYSYGKPYPWTGLGYTFDWARKSDSNDFERYGESEFVIPKRTSVHFYSATSTSDYCAAQ
jgi:hypothetical protein